MMVAVKKSWLWIGIGPSEKNRFWYMTNVQSDQLLHGYMLSVFFATDQLHRPPFSVEIQPMSQQDASTTHPYRDMDDLIDDWLMVLDEREKLKKMKNLCILQSSAVTFFRCGGWGSNSFFFFCDNVNSLKYIWIILLKNDFFGFPKVKWLQYTGEMSNCTSYWCQIFSGFNTPKIIKIG